MNSVSSFDLVSRARKEVMPLPRKHFNSKPAVSTNTKWSEIHTNHRGRRFLNSAPFQEHTQVMREAKRLREQVRVRAVNAEYTHLNHTLGLKNECPSLPKISKQQTLKTCISHIKKLREELSVISGHPQVQTSLCREQDSIKPMHDTQPLPNPQSQMYVPAFSMYMPNLCPLPQVSSELDSYSSGDSHSFSSDDVSYDFGLYNYPYPCADADYDSIMMPGQPDSDGSDGQNASETFSSELFTDFPNYSDSFCSTPDTPSSPYSWLLQSPWPNLEDN